MERARNTGTTPGNHDDRLERVLGRVLFTGTAASTVLLAVGLVSWIAGRRGAFASSAFQFGVLVLMATPVVRVVVSVVEYARERDWFFVATTLTVLAVLAATVVAALRTAMGAG